ncbi:ABC transporter substrate-binding protein [Acidaminobacter sp. JC074]|uniref:metal ABC transporter solute-binding protein, Zn/Mn family n=1 Tax=Acidaminobacter sp. JC074 TaxID=2530199 RepID=UPI001F0E584D|nr:zinc ABC transporter substrate-binding protein [Acidaminobacter sp. JC074]MCH4885941.1 ABC transporter substrate-binding protein [Acidaminobacter sp. JC074]
MKKLIIILSIMMLALVGCSDNTSDQLTVAVSIVPQETFVKAVAGDLVDVVVLIPPGSSPANYQPSPQEMAKFNESKVYFHIDVAAEAHILESVNDDVKLVDLAEFVDEKYPARYFEEGHDHEDEHDADHEDEHDADHEDEHDADHEDEHDADHEDEAASEHDHDHSGRDPHIWLSPKRVQVMVEVIRDELSALDPDNKETYAENAAAYIEELKGLDKYLEQSFENVDHEFIMYHPSLGYFADDYGFDMHAIEAEGKQATARDLEMVIELAKAEGIKYVFYQEEFDSSQAEIVAKEIGGTTIKVAPLSGDYINNLKTIAEKMLNSFE